jgi:hypothetical protein
MLGPLPADPHRRAYRIEGLSHATHAEPAQQWSAARRVLWFSGAGWGLAGAAIGLGRGRGAA